MKRKRLSAQYVMEMVKKPVPPAMDRVKARVATVMVKTSKDVINALVKVLGCSTHMAMTILANMVTTTESIHAKNATERAILIVQTSAARAVKHSVHTATAAEKKPVIVAMGKERNKEFFISFF